MYYFLNNMHLNYHSISNNSMYIYYHLDRYMMHIPTHGQQILDLNVQTHLLTHNLHCLYLHLVHTNDNNNNLPILLFLMSQLGNLTRTLLHLLSPLFYLHRYQSNQSLEKLLHIFHIYSDIEYHS